MIQSRTYTISGSPAVLDRLERFFALLHYNAGHSAIFGMWLDGDGADRVCVEPPPSPAFRQAAQNIGGALDGVEYASGRGYTAAALDRTRATYRCEVGKDGSLRRVPPAP